MPIVKIANKPTDDEEKVRPIIVIIGRVHPSETYSSFVIHGLLNHLLS